MHHTREQKKYILSTFVVGLVWVCLLQIVVIHLHHVYW